ncbi:MAG: hypothetical protein RJB66_1128 [Pseudomonadota bacterium]|jgi:hypothetical protein
MVGKKAKAKKKVTKKKPAQSKMTKKTSGALNNVLKKVDSNLLKLPPKVQANIDQVLKSIDVSPIKLQDLRALGYRILKHATEISENIKRTKPGKKSTRK